MLIPSYTINGPHIFQTQPELSNGEPCAKDRCTGLQETARRLEQDVFPGLASSMQSHERRAQNLKDGWAARGGQWRCEPCGLSSAGGMPESGIYSDIVWYSVIRYTPIGENDKPSNLENLRVPYFQTNP
jgi:hypothetical protein